MKKLLLNYLFALVLMAGLVACGGNEQKEEETDNTKDTSMVEDTDATKKEFRRAIKAYMQLKDALVNSDVNTAKIAAKKLSGKVSDDIHNAAEEIYATDELKKQREIFNMISEKMYTQLKEKGGNERPIYKQFCPMAFDNAGAFWLSEEEAIKNPYFGDEMMNCGEVQETLAAN